LIREIVLPTKRFPSTPASEFPSVFNSDGCYPYVQFSRTSDTPEQIELKAVLLENDCLAVIVCPSLNGRILSLKDKVSGKETLYRNDVIKPCRILPRWGWSPGGIEFNLPIAHSPTALEPVGWRMIETNGRSVVQVGETERRYGLSWLVELSLGEGEDFLTQRTLIRNDGVLRAPWCLWTNASIRSTPETTYYYPSGRVLRHAHVADEVVWPDIGVKEKDYDRMTGLFWEARGNAFAAWHPEENIGLMHLADPNVLIGMKMWTYGIGKHSGWCSIFTDNGLPYAEIQSGATADQSQILYLESGHERSFIEFWKPIRTAPDISTAQLPSPKGEFPERVLFGNEHIVELMGWNELKERYGSGQWEGHIEPPASPPPPLPEYEESLRYAYRQNPDKWREHLATYLCAKSETFQTELDIPEISRILASSKTAGEYRLLGLLYWKKLGDRDQGAFYLGKAHELSKDVGLACELDQCLAEACDREGRSRLLAKFQSGDLRWVERKIDFLLDFGKPLEAKTTLLGTKWDLYHLRQVRTRLYRRCQRALGLEEHPIPESLGEDDMCDWGAYRPQSADRH
jgi:hypothetical protein